MIVTVSVHSFAYSAVIKYSGNPVNCFSGVLV